MVDLAQTTNKLTFCTVKGDSLLKGVSSLADVITMNLGQVSIVTKGSLTEAESTSSSFLVLFVDLQKAEEAIFRRKVIHHT